MLWIIIIDISGRGSKFIFSISIHLSLLENLYVPDKGEAATAYNTNSNTNTDFLLILTSALSLSLEYRV